MGSEGGGRCEKCGGEVIPSRWKTTDGAGWEGVVGIGTCGCEFGLPVIKEGDILIDRTYHAIRTSFGGQDMFRAKNIMAIQRPRINDIGHELWVSFWRRGENIVTEGRNMKARKRLYLVETVGEETYVISTDAGTAYQTVRDFMDEEDHDFESHRRLISVKELAQEDTRWPNVTDRYKRLLVPENKVTGEPK